MTESQREIIRTFHAVPFLGGMIATSLWMVKPFLGAAIWAVTTGVATRPLMISIQSGI